MRRAAKVAVEKALVATGVASFLRGRRPGRPLVLAYHNVVPDQLLAERLDSSHLPLTEFVRQLDILTELSAVVPLTEILKPADAGDPRPRIAITFDDAYRGAVALGVEELARRGLPATFFVAPGILGDRAMWWDDLPVRPWDEDRFCLGELQGDDVRIRAWAMETGRERRELDPYCRTCYVEELERAAAVPGVTFGAHGWHHRNMAALPPSALEEELVGPLEWLREHFPERRIPWVAYPYGHASSDVQRAARAAGYQRGISIRGGFLPQGDEADPFLLPRFNVPAGLSGDGFRLRLSGVLAR